MTRKKTDVERHGKFVYYPGKDKTPVSLTLTPEAHDILKRLKKSAELKKRFGHLPSRAELIEHAIHVLGNEGINDALRQLID